MAKDHHTKPPRGISVELSPPKTPVTLMVDGEIDGPDLVRRLAAGGLEMRNVPDAAGKARWALIATCAADEAAEDVRILLGGRLDDVACYVAPARSIIHSVIDCLEQLEAEDSLTGPLSGRPASCLYGVVKILDEAYSLCASRREVSHAAQ